MIGDLGADSGMASLVDGELMTQGEHLKLEGHPCSEARAEGSEEGEEESLHGGDEANLPQPRRPEVFDAELLLRERP